MAGPGREGIHAESERAPGASAAFLATGEMIGRYRVERLLGIGGMGHVYQAIHVALNKRVAVKLLNHEYSRDQAYVQRFFNEARAAASLSHVNVIDVTDFEQLPDGRLFMVLEYLEGESLSSFLQREGPLTPAAALAILLPVCSGVGAAHARNIIHRDLKPGNIFLVRRGGADRIVKVLDFGVAKLHDEMSSGEITRSGTAIGSPNYMSPEQARGQSALVGPPSDVYSLGVVAFLMLCGRRPFLGRNFRDLVLQHVQKAPPPLRSIRPELPASLELVLDKALKKDPRERFQRMEEFAQALAAALDPAGEAELKALLVPPERGDPHRRARTWTAPQAPHAINSAPPPSSGRSSRSSRRPPSGARPRGPQPAARGRAV